MSFIPKPHEIYKHFKGDLYQVTTVAEHTETGEQLVVYQALYGDFKTYARPLAMFTDRVDKGKHPDAGQEFRFELQGPEAGRQRKESELPALESEAGTVRTSEEKDRSGALDPAAGSEAQDGSVPGAPEDADGVGEELSIDPLVLEFLDSDSYEQRLNIMAGLHHRITDDMITTMAIACDIEIGDGEVEERYEALKTCLLTLQRYECSRLR